MKRTLTTLALIAATLVPAAASAQSSGGDGLAQRGSFVLGGERLTGLYFYSFKQTSTTTVGNTTVSRDSTKSGTQVNLLWGSQAASGTGFGNPASIPRLGGDYFVTEMISIGGSLGYSTSSGSQKDNNSGVSQDTPTYTLVALSPRVGFGIPITGSFTFWPRVGFQYVNGKSTTKNVANNGTSTEASDSTTLYGLFVEGMFVYAPVPHFGFGFGPIIELGLGGGIDHKVNNVTTSTDLKGNNFGAIAGLVGYL
jgi:hypothetical protein